MAPSRVLLQAIENVLAKESFANLEKASQELSLRYRNPNGRTDDLPFMCSEIHKKSYLLTRMPATYAAVCRVLQEIVDEQYCQSILDIGAGPGTCMWAAADVLEDVTSFTLVEQDRDMIALGKKLADFSDNSALKSAKWIADSMLNYTPEQKYDMIILSYAIGELPLEKSAKIIERLWGFTNKYLIIIEPGTVAGYTRIRNIRDQLLTLKGNIVAPCPHGDTCPIKENDWCHFSQRLERSSLHKKAKDGMLSYEDEKFSYVVMSKQKQLVETKVDARIIRHPMKHTGHVGMTVCTAESGIQNITISKKQGEAYKKARKADWGDVL